MNELLIVVFSFILGGIVSQVIRLSMSRYWERARPSVTIIKVSKKFSNVEEDSLLNLGYSLQYKLSKTSLIKIPKEGVQTILEARKIIRKTSSDIRASKVILTHIEGILEKNYLLDSTLSEDKKRSKIIGEIFKVASEPIQSLAKNIITSNLDIISEKYKDSHPKEWKGLENASIFVEELGSHWNLREINIEKELDQEINVRGPVGVLERTKLNMEVTNILRRIFIFLYEKDIRWLLTKIREKLSEVNSKANNVISELKEEVKKISNDFLNVQVMINNSGKRHFAITGRAWLEVTVNTVKGNDSIFIPLHAESRKKVLRGTDGCHISYTTDISLNEFNFTSQNNSYILNGENFNSLFESSIIPVRIASQIQTDNEIDPKIIVSSSFSMGYSAESQLEKLVLEKLTSTSEKRS